MKRQFRNFRILFLTMFLLSACAAPASPGKPTESPEMANTTAGPTVTVTPEPPTPTGTARPSPDGPYLLLQSGADKYRIINFADLSIMPFDPPGPNQQYNLRENLSPSGTQMIFPIHPNETVVYSFLRGEVHTTYHLESDSSIFQPDLAAAAARKALPGLKYSDEALLTAVKNALQQSINNIQWYTSDRYRLTVLPATESSTQLTLDDHQTGMRVPLEVASGLVEDYWVGPSGENILLKKGFMFDPGVWQDDRYYLVNVREREAEPIPLPENADNPRVFWFSTGKLGIIHQPELAGGVDFSMVETESLTRDLTVSGPFDDLRQIGGKVLTTNQDKESTTTILTLWNIAGQEIHSQDVAGLCFFSASIGGSQMAMNCGTESVLVDSQEEGLSVSPFEEALFLLRPSPDERFYVLVTQDSKTILLDGSLDKIEPLSLEVSPLEILWLPDSSGFLYRTPLSLYLYQIETKSNTLIIQSDLFGDYRNLNAVWIQLEE